MDNTENTPRFDFDYWRKLARQDPQAFEAARRNAVVELINAAPVEQQKRMQGLQWRIDRVRESSTNPLAACLKLSSMMWDALLGDDGLVATLRELETIEPGKSPARRLAKVVPLNRENRKSEPV